MFANIISALLDANQQLIDSGTRASDENFSFVHFPKGQYRHRLIVCGFPGRPSDQTRATKSLAMVGSPETLARWLQEKFPDCEYMVWNLSGAKYNTLPLNDNVVTYDFPSRAVPPLDALIEIALAIHSWLNKDPNNVAVCHDLSGRRAAIAVTCAMQLTWTQHESVLQNVVMPVLGRVGEALVPSQHRYYGYFCALALGNGQLSPIPNKRFECLRLIVNGIPNFDGGGSCRPCFQIMDRNGDIVGESTEPNSNVVGLEGSFVLVPRKSPITLAGDVLIRVFHVVEGGGTDGQQQQRIPMFAMSFHTGFFKQDELVIRFLIEDVDGATSSSRFPPDFFVDLILGDVKTDDAGVAAGATADIKVQPPRPPMAKSDETVLREIEEMLTNSSEGGHVVGLSSFGESAGSDGTKTSDFDLKEEDFELT